MRPDNEILIFAGDEQLLSLQASASRRLGLKKPHDFHGWKDWKFYDSSTRDVFLRFVPMFWDWNLIRYDVLFEKGFGLGYLDPLKKSGSKPCKKTGRLHCDHQNSYRILTGMESSSWLLSHPLELKMFIKGRTVLDLQGGNKAYLETPGPANDDDDTESRGMRWSFLL